MKSWSATAAKFYSETMNGLAAFFGLNAEETTEAELHHQLAGIQSQIGLLAASGASQSEVTGDGNGTAEPGTTHAAT